MPDSSAMTQTSDESPKTDQSLDCSRFEKPDHWPPEHPATPFGKTGLLLVNLGTPDSLEVSDIRKYLKEFLSDRRVIEVNRVLWWLLLNGIILNTRPRKTREAYAKIWMTEQDVSPLRYYTEQQTDKLREMLADHSDHLVVDWAMRYGNPSIESRLKRLQAQGCERIVVVALYPHYAAPTSATVYDKCFDALKKMRWQPVMRAAAPWHDHPVFIDALAKSIETHLAGLDHEPEKIILSYHGLPQEYFDKGDPYHCHCHKTTRLVRERLGWPDDGRLVTTFQSRFGKAEWIKPYTDETVEHMAEHDGVKSIAVITPGFVSDCVETLEEINIELRDDFIEAGGEKFSFIPCLNDTEDGMAVLHAIARRELAGWVDV
ncbi:MAG: ferrochelatase [Alphaproteobacteria bacterium]